MNRKARLDPRIGEKIELSRRGFLKGAAAAAMGVLGAQLAVGTLPDLLLPAEDEDGVRQNPELRPYLLRIKKEEELIDANTEIISYLSSRTDADLTKLDEWGKSWSKDFKTTVLIGAAGGLASGVATLAKEARETRLAKEEAGKRERGEDVPPRPPKSLFKDRVETLPTLGTHTAVGLGAGTFLATEAQLLFKRGSAPGFNLQAASYYTNSKLLKLLPLTRENVLKKINILNEENEKARDKIEEMRKQMSRIKSKKV